jgi:uncharacterized protein (TIGR03000 family)
MPRSLWTYCLVGVVSALSAAPAARAQQVGVGVTPFGVRGGYWPGYLGYFPGAYGGFWSNGFSLYGPPVPTYGTVPGYFGGADQRLSNFSNIYIGNGASIGLGTPGAGGAGPRRRHWANLGAGETDFGVGQATGQAVIDVRVPAANAEVFFEGINTRQTGVRRVFHSPAIQVETTFYYQVRARWVDDGKVQDQVRPVGVRANETIVVDFAKTDSAADTKPLLGVE